MNKLEVITCEQYGATPEEACSKLYAELSRVVEINPAAQGGYTARLKVGLDEKQRQIVMLE